MANTSAKADNLESLLKQLEDAKLAGDTKLVKELDKLIDKEIGAQTKFKAGLEKIGERFEVKLEDAAKSVVNKVDSSLKNYVDNQEKVIAHLNGAAESFSSINSTLSSALAGSSIVNQQNVYNQMVKLVTSGITSNVEQKAYLQQLAEDMSMTYDASDKNLNRLTNLFRQNGEFNENELSSFRLAIEYDLEEFLNTNYETSTYLKDAFQSVADSLVQSQTYMSQSMAESYESTVQTWLGAYYSSGLNSSTVSSLASAINAIGSGDVSNLGNGGIYNLLLMAATNQGLDFSEIITNGLDDSTVASLLQGVSNVVNDLGATDNNVVRSQLASVLGIDYSDFKAIANAGSITGSVSTNISDLLEDVDEMVPFAQKVENVLNNIYYSLASNIANSNTQYLWYKGSEIIANTVGSVLEGVSTDLFGFNVNWGSVVKALPILALLPSVASEFGDILNGVSSSLSGNSATSIYNALSNSLSSSSIKSSGGNALQSGSSTSDTLYVSNNSSVSGMFDSAMSSFKDFTSNTISGTEESYTTTDVYKQLDAGRISITGDNFDTVNASITESSAKMLDLISGQTEIVQQIFDLLSSYFGGDTAVYTVSDMYSAINEATSNISSGTYDTSGFTHLSGNF